MMVNRQKNKGTKWERDLAKELNTLLDTDSWKRVPGSGALGTILKESRLMGDVTGNVEWLGNIVLEAKVGYGGSKQLAIKKAWFDKVAEEAEISHSIPAVACKFSNARTGVRHFIAFDIEVFAEIMKQGNAILKELEELYDRLEASERKLEENN